MPLAYLKHFKLELNLKRLYCSGSFTFFLEKKVEKEKPAPTRKAINSDSLTKTSQSAALKREVFLRSLRLEFLTLYYVKGGMHKKISLNVGLSNEFSRNERKKAPHSVFAEQKVGTLANEARIRLSPSWAESSFVTFLSAKKS